MGINTFYEVMGIDPESNLSISEKEVKVQGTAREVSQMLAFIIIIIEEDTNNTFGDVMEAIRKAKEEVKEDFENADSPEEFLNAMMNFWDFQRDNKEE